MFTVNILNYLNLIGKEFEIIVILIPRCNPHFPPVLVFSVSLCTLYECSHHTLLIWRGKSLHQPGKLHNQLWINCWWRAWLLLDYKENWKHKQQHVIKNTLFLCSKQGYLTDLCNCVGTQIGTADCT